jgi:hypothetical protein
MVYGIVLNIKRRLRIMTTKQCATKEYREKTGVQAMTKQMLKGKVLNCLNSSSKHFESIVDRALNSGAIDFESHNENDNGLIAIVMCYVYSNMLEACQPNVQEDKNELKNLLKF